MNDFSVGHGIISGDVVSSKVNATGEEYGIYTQSNALT